MLFKKKTKEKGLFINVQELRSLIDRRVNLILESKVDDRLIKDIGLKKILNHIEKYVTEDDTNLKLNIDTNCSICEFEISPAFNYSNSFIKAAALIKEVSLLNDDIILFMADTLNDYIGPVNVSKDKGSLLSFCYKCLFYSYTLAKNNSYFYQDNATKDASLILLYLCSAYCLGRVQMSSKIYLLKDKDEYLYHPFETSLKDFVNKTDSFNLKQVFLDKANTHFEILKTGIALSSDLTKEIYKKLDNKDLIYKITNIKEDSLLFRILSKAIAIAFNIDEYDKQYLEAIRPVFICAKHTPENWDSDPNFSGKPYFYEKDMLLNANIHQAVSYFVNKNEAVIQRFLQEYKDTVQKHFLETQEENRKNKAFEKSLETINEATKKDFEKRENKIKEIQTTLECFNTQDEESSTDSDITKDKITKDDTKPKLKERKSTTKVEKKAVKQDTEICTKNSIDDYIRRLDDIVDLSKDNDDLKDIIEKDCTRLKKCLELLDSFSKDKVLVLDFSIGNELNEANNFFEYYQILKKVLLSFNNNKPSSVVESYIARFIDEHLKKLTLSIMRIVN